MATRIPWIRAAIGLLVLFALGNTPLTAAQPGTSGSPETAQAEFSFMSESAVLNPATQEVVFTIEFNQSPDFFTVDSFGRQAHSFQYFIVGDSNLPYPANFDAIIRAEEIHSTVDEIRIRNSTPSDADPAAGGWGPIRGVVPYRLNGNVLTFSVPLELVSDHHQDGTFVYQLEAYQFGSLTRHIDNQSAGSPIPRSQADCKNGGWREHTRANGSPFKNQGECIKYVTSGR